MFPAPASVSIQWQTDPKELELLLSIILQTLLEILSKDEALLMFLQPRQEEVGHLLDAWPKKSPVEVEID